MLSLENRINVLVELGHYLQLKDDRLMAFIKRTAFNKKWFTEDNQLFAIDMICQQFLNRTNLDQWIADHSIQDTETPKSIGIIADGNIPLSSFHDIICSFVLGNNTIVKLPEDDLYLMPFLIKKMNEMLPGVEDYFSFPGKLPFREMDAILISGKKETTKHFESYFKDTPLLVRNEKRSVAIINGNEEKEDFKKLAIDILKYYGIGNRNVSKLFVPKDYDFNLFLETLHEFKDIIRFDGYKNNYDYQISVLILNKMIHWNNGSIILSENVALFSPISVLNYEVYHSQEALISKINADARYIHSIVSKNPVDGLETIPFGSSLSPSLNDYESDKNVIQFLQQLN